MFWVFMLDCQSMKPLVQLYCLCQLDNYTYVAMFNTPGIGFFLHGYLRFFK